MKLNCIIADDEQGAQAVLESYIGKLEDMVLCGQFFNALDAFRYIKANQVDLVLLDINMPEIDGFGLLDMLEHKPMVIFTTAYSDHALKGFDYNAVDYLCKPIRFERFVKAIEKAQKWHSLKHARTTADHVELKIDGVSRNIKTADIYYIESLGNYIRLHTAGGAPLVLMTMTELENKLPPGKFVRLHKSYLVNAQHLQKMSPDEVVIAGTHLPVGKTYKKYFSEFMKSIKGGDN